VVIAEAFRYVVGCHQAITVAVKPTERHAGLILGHAQPTGHEKERKAAEQMAAGGPDTYQVGAGDRRRGPTRLAIAVGRDVEEDSRTVVDVGAVVDVENVHGARGVVDAVDDPVGSAAGAVAAC
jgi:hypothetical protein